MIRRVIGGLVALAAVAVAVENLSGQQPTPTDKIFVVNKKDGTTKTYEGVLKLSGAGLQILGPDGKLLAAAAPGDIAKVEPGELAGIDRGVVLGLLASEAKKTKAEYVKARDGYLDLQVRQACGTDTPAPRIDQATWNAWCDEFSDFLRPVYEGVRAASGKPY